MSAADPAIPPTPPTVNGSEGAYVIPITARRAGRRASQLSGGRTSMEPTSLPMPGPPVSAGERAVREAALRLVADDVEKIFNQTRRTLTDEETAGVYVIALQIVQHTLKGAVVSGILTEEQRGELDVLLGGLKDAPRLV